MTNEQIEKVVGWLNRKEIEALDLFGDYDGFLVITTRSVNCGIISEASLSLQLNVKDEDDGEE